MSLKYFLKSLWPGYTSQTLKKKLLSKDFILKPSSFLDVKVLIL